MTLYVRFALFAVRILMFFTVFMYEAQCINVTYCSLTLPTYSICVCELTLTVLCGVLLHCHSYHHIVFGSPRITALWHIYVFCPLFRVQHALSPVEPCGVPAAALSDTFCVKKTKKNKKHLSALDEKMLVFLQSLPWVIE